MQITSHNSLEAHHFKSDGAVSFHQGFYLNNLSFTCLTYSLRLFFLWQHYAHTHTHTQSLSLSLSWWCGKFNSDEVNSNWCCKANQTDTTQSSLSFNAVVCVSCGNLDNRANENGYANEKLKEWKIWSHLMAIWLMRMNTSAFLLIAFLFLILFLMQLPRCAIGTR